MLSDISYLYYYSPSEMQPTHVFIGLRSSYKYLKIRIGTIWHEKSPSCADIVISRAILSIEMTLSLESVFKKIVGLWVSFPMQLESPNLEVCRGSYG